MIRILFATALGGTITLLLLSFTGSIRFNFWAAAFGIATVALGTLSVFLGFVIGAARSRAEIAEARKQGRIRAALILGSKHTGVYVNELPQIEFTLLVDRRGRKPFVTKVRAIVPMVDLHTVTPDALVAVAHSSPETNRVLLLAGETVPQPSQELTREKASTAAELPAPKKMKLTTTIASLAIAFVVGALGAPFLSVPNPHEYLRLAIEGRTDEVHRLDHPVLFEIDELQRSIDAMTDDLGHDSVYQLRINDVSMIAEVSLTPLEPVVADPTSLDEASDAAESTTIEIDRVTVRGHSIIRQEPSSLSDFKTEMDAFSIAEVNWPGVFAGIEEARGIAESRGLNEPVLNSIGVSRDTSSFRNIEVSIYLSNARGQDETVQLDAEGQLTPSELFALMPAAEQATYLLDATTLETAIREMLEVVGTEHIVDIVNYGDRVHLEAFIDSGDGTGRLVDIDYREGHVSGVSNTAAARIAPEELFRFDDVDWPGVFAAIPETQRIMHDAGAADTVVTHIITDMWQLFSADQPEISTRIYLSNEWGDGGYIVVDVDGNVTRVQGP